MAVSANSEDLSLTSCEAASAHQETSSITLKEFKELYQRAYDAFSLFSQIPLPYQAENIKAFPVMGRRLCLHTPLQRLEITSELLLLEYFVLPDGTIGFVRYLIGPAPEDNVRTESKVQINNETFIPTSAPSSRSVSDKIAALLEYAENDLTPIDYSFLLIEENETT